MPTTINAGATASISLPAEQIIIGRGPGSAIVTSTQASFTQPLTAGDEWRIGPFDQVRTVGVTAGAAAISYDVSAFVDPARPVVVGDDGQVRDSKNGAPVSGGGLVSPTAYSDATALQTAYPAASNSGKLGLVGASAPYALYASNGTAWVAAGSSGGGAWGSITGTLGDQTDLVAALAAKADYRTPVTLSADTALTASAHANRTVYVDTAGLTLTINNDATTGAASGDTFDIQAVGTGTFGVVQGTGTISTGPGMSASSATAVAKRVQLEHAAAANTWTTLSAKAPPSAGAALVKGDGSGGLTTAVAGVDYTPGVALSMSTPLVFPSNGSIGSNGALTLGIGLPSTFSDGCWMYFPANAINSGSAAGWYWVVMSSGTAGTVYNNVYTPGTNSGAGSWQPVASPTAFSGTTGASYTTPSGIDTLAVQYTIPGGSLGTNGSGRLVLHARMNNNANSKTIRVYMGSAITQPILGNSVSNSSQGFSFYLRGRTDRVVILTPDQGSSGGASPLTLDMTVNQTLGIYHRASTPATDYQILEVAQLTLAPSA